MPVRGKGSESTRQDRWGSQLSELRHAIRSRLPAKAGRRRARASDWLSSGRSRAVKAEVRRRTTRVSRHPFRCNCASTRRDGLNASFDQVGSPESARGGTGCRESRPRPRDSRCARRRCDTIMQRIPNLSRAAEPPSGNLAWSRNMCSFQDEPRRRTGESGRA